MVSFNTFLMRVFFFFHCWCVLLTVVLVTLAYVVYLTILMYYMKGFQSTWVCLSKVILSEKQKKSVISPIFVFVPTPEMNPAPLTQN